MTDQERREKYPDITIPNLTPEATRDKSQPSLGDLIVPQITDLGGPRVILEDGTVKIDQQALNDEENSVSDWLKNGIRSGNSKILGIYLRTLNPNDPEEAALAEKLRTAFEQKNPEIVELDALHVNIVTGGIAERNLIREGLIPELVRYPFTFRDSRGQTLSPDDLDIVFAKGEEGKFQLIVGAKKGISTIAFEQEELSQDQYIPDMANADKDAVSDIIIIPLKPSKSGRKPSAPSVQIRKGPIDLPAIMAREDEIARDNELIRQREAEEQKRRQADEERRQYQPPKPKRYAGESRWVSSTSN